MAVSDPGQGSRPTARLGALVICALLLLAGPASAQTERGDFNGDGCDDLALGAFGETVDGVEGAGVVHVIYHVEGDAPACTGGFDLGKSGLFSQEATNLPDNAQALPGPVQPFDNFGAALAAGDFNGDNISDLAIGVPNDNIGAENAGGVNIVYGSADGLTTENTSQSHAAEFTGQDTPLEFEDEATAGERFGFSVAAGDFNGDGVDDLAAGVINEEVGEAVDAGGVHIVYGSSTLGLFQRQAPDADELFTRAGDVRGEARSGAHCGWSLAAGNFNGEGGPEDLAFGCPSDFAGLDFEAGSANVLYGNPGTVGLDPHGVTENQLYAQSTRGIKGTGNLTDRFGTALAAGDFDGNGIDDLATGVPGEDRHGAVSAIYGGTGGLTARDQLFHQDSELGGNPIKGEAEEKDFFGVRLATADFGADGRDDLAIGVPREDRAAGAVNVVYGGRSALTGRGDQLFTQLGSLAGRKEAGDFFGDTLAAGDFGLAIGAFNENVDVPGGDPIKDAGGVNIIFGVTSKLSLAGNLGFDQSVFGGEGPEPNDFFGAGLGAEE